MPSSVWIRVKEMGKALRILVRTLGSECNLLHGPLVSECKTESGEIPPSRLVVDFQNAN